MEKKESPKKENNLNFKPKGIPARLFNIIKFFLGILFLPFIYSVSLAFFNEFSLIGKSGQDAFLSGIITLLAVYLFIWEPQIIYIKGQQILELVFSFFKPLVRVAPYLLPIYTIILFFFYLVLILFFKSQDLTNYFVFLFGISTALHFIFGAKSLRTRQEDFLKGNYIFGFSFVYAINVILLAMLFNFIFDKFSFVNFLNNTFQIANAILGAVFKQLFL